jgi:hypothetical protein
MIQWSRDESIQLLDMLEQGHSLNSIAKELGRSYNAVYYKMMKLKKKRAPPPRDSCSVLGLAIVAVVSVYAFIVSKSFYGSYEVAI